MHFNRKDLSDDFLRSLYSDLLLPRLIEEKMLIQLRQGKISKWFSGIGQEAISVGLVKALKKDDYLLPLHRNLGAFTTRGLDLKRLFCQWQGKKAGYTNIKNLFGSIFEWVNQKNDVVDKDNTVVKKVHTYNWLWSKWVDKTKIERVW